MSTNQCVWCRYADGGPMPGVIDIDVDDFLIGLNFNRCTDGMCGRKVKQSSPEFESDSSSIFPLNSEDYTHKFFTEAPGSRETAKQRQELLTPQELSVL